MAAGLETMLSPWLPDYKQCYPHGYRSKKNVTPPPPWPPDYKQCYPHGCRIINNVTPMATGL